MTAHNGLHSVLWFAIMLAMGVKAEGCDCHNLTLTPSPVCGEGFITFINRCVAECQGAGVLHEGICGTGDALHFKASQLSPTEGDIDLAAPAIIDYNNGSKLDVAARVDLNVLNLFSDQGYLYSAKVQMQTEMAPERRLSLAATSTERSPEGQPVLGVRLTKAGHLYVRPASLPGNGNSNATGELGASFAAGSHGSISQQDKGRRRLAAAAGRRAPGNRRMLVVGADNRTEVKGAEAEEYPYTTVGFIKFKVSGGTGGCSGALVGRRSVLTAGHCVYDTQKRQFYDIEKMAFYPNQHRGTSVRPVNVSLIMTYFNNAEPASDCGGGNFECQTALDYFYDFALITLEEDIGDEYGWLGYGYECSFEEYRVNTAGYPGDLPGWGNRMYGTSGTLGGFRGCDMDLENNLVVSDIDAFQGQSGSATWDNEFMVRALINAGIMSSSANGSTKARALHRVISEWVFDKVKEEVDANLGTSKE